MIGQDVYSHEVCEITIKLSLDRLTYFKGNLFTHVKSHSNHQINQRLCSLHFILIFVMSSFGIS